MSKKELVVIGIFLIATVGTVVGVSVIEKYRRNKLFTAELIARAPEYGNWYPKSITVPYGEEVRLLIRNIDTVTHGFAIPDLQISINEIKAGEVKVITFKPDKIGSIPFMCTIWCSNRHMEMRGELIVNDNR